MADTPWQDRIVGDRMQVDQKFAERVSDAGLSQQEWGLVMTAVDFEIRHPDDPERAELVADTEKVRHMMPEIEKVQQQMGGVPGQQSSGGGGSGMGFIDSVKSALGVGGDEGDASAEKQAEAERLAREYATMLQRHLEETDRWEDVCRLAASE